MFPFLFVCLFYLPVFGYFVCLFAYIIIFVCVYFLIHFRKFFCTLLIFIHFFLWRVSNQYCQSMYLLHVYCCFIAFKNHRLEISLLCHGFVMGIFPMTLNVKILLWERYKQHQQQNGILQDSSEPSAFNFVTSTYQVVNYQVQQGNQTFLDTKNVFEYLKFNSQTLSNTF